uniref:Transmembrane channel-like protein n=1 Tax=Nothobranchius kuhntae TaxID=321403 RepID=A0A1A8JHT7_NOTKU
MARNVNFDLNLIQMEAGIESPTDEEGVHDAFSQLIAEQSLNEDPNLFIELREEDEDDLDNVANLSNARHRLGEEGMSHDDDGGCYLGRGQQPTDSLIKERWSSDTLKVLSSMPSRTIGRSRGAIISQYYNKTMKLRRDRQSRPAVRDFSRSARPSIRCHGMEADTPDSWDMEETKRERLVNNLQNLSVGDRERMIRGMPLSLKEKGDLRKLALQKDKHTHSSSKLHCCSQQKYYIIIALRRSWYSCLSFLHSLHLWQMPLKRVSSRFGTGVLSYFLFLKTLFLFNIFLVLITGVFLVIPQALHPPTPPANWSSFSGLELLTGAGYFSDSLMYYGYYSNYTLHRNGSSSSRLDLSYNMPLAYFFTIGMAFFITCMILVYSMSKSFGQSFMIDKSHSILAIKAFSSWDFKVIKESSVKLMSENICTQLKELLAEVNQNNVSSTTLQKCGRLMVHGLAWTICTAGTAGCAMSIYLFSDYMHNQSRAGTGAQGRLQKEASLLALPVLVSLINLLLPGLFNLASWFENYHSPSVRTYVSISRNLLSKVSVLCVLCYHWLGRIATDSMDHIKCWESYVGQELYRFLIIDFIFTLLDTLCGELLWRFFSDKVLKKRRRPGFDIAKNVLDLIYGQTLAWLGVLFTPLLPAMQILKLLLLFYIKMSSVMMNCQAPRRPYRVTQMTTIFISLLCFPSFIGAAVCVTYTMWSTKPSVSCGPFRGLNKMVQAGKIWMKQLEEENPNLSVLARAYAYLVENPLFLFMGAGIFLIVIYFHSEVVDGERKIINILQEQIENEGEDKKFLITELQSVHEQKRVSRKRVAHQNSGCYSGELRHDKPLEKPTSVW